MEQVTADSAVNSTSFPPPPPITPDPDTSLNVVRWPINAKEEFFCAQVSCGVNLNEAAINAGYAEEYGRILAQKQHIVKRIATLCSVRATESDGPMSKHWLMGVQVKLIEMSYRGVPAETNDKGEVIRQAVAPDLVLCAKVIMDNAKLRGFVIDRKQTFAGKLDLAALPEHQLGSALDQVLGQLSPEQRSRVQEIAGERRKPGRPRKQSAPQPVVVEAEQSDEE